MPSEYHVTDGMSIALNEFAIAEFKRRSPALKHVEQSETSSLISIAFVSVNFTVQ